jgi:uncharacterized RDD family membrane protein YckC
MIMNYKTRHEFLNDNEFILATIKKRFVAFLIDLFFLILIYLFIIFVFGLFDMNISKINVISLFEVEMEMENAHSYVIFLLKILFGLLPILYFSMSLYFFKGQTIGKYLLKIKVLSIYHEHIGLWHCIERSLGYIASALEFGFGYIQAFWNPNRMALHDKIGETVVIDCPVKKNN